MPVTKLSDLTSAGSLASGDLFYVVQTAGVGGKKATLSQLATLLGSSFLGLTAQAADSAKLGGTAAASFLLASTAASTYQTQSGMSAYQLALVSGTSIKTVGGVSLLGSGDVSVGGGGDMLLGTAQEVTAAKTFDVSTLLLKGSTSGTSTLNAAAVAGTTTFTLPGSSGTLALLSDIPSLSGYETTSHASSTYQTLTGMSGYLTTAGTAADSAKLGGTSAASYALLSDLSPYLTSATAASTYQTILVSGTSLKTINSASLLGSGNVTLATLGANTFTSLQTITVGAANTGVLASTGYSLTGSDATPMVNLAGTWNTSGTPTAIKLNVTDTASNASSLLLDLQVGSASKFRITKAGYIQFIAGSWSPSMGPVGTSLTSLGVFNAALSDYADLWTSSNYVKGALSVNDHLSIGTTHGTDGDTRLYRDAAYALAQRNGANAQTLRVYNTYTDASNYERGVFDWTTNANVLMIGTEKAGTGLQRDVKIQVAGNSSLYFTINGSDRVYLTSGRAAPITTLTYDLGHSADRFRSCYLGQSLTGSATTGAIDISTTWNTSGTPNLINIAVTDTASNAASMLIKAVVGSATVFGVDKAGKPTFGTHSALAAETVTGYITIVDAGGTTRKLAVVS